MKTKWDLTHIFLNTEEWEQGKKDLEQAILEWKQLIDKMSFDTESLMEAIKHKIKVDALIEKVYCYPKRFLDLDNQDTEKLGMFEIAKTLYSEILELTEKFTNRILENSSLVAAFLKENPYYQRYIEVIKKNALESSNEVLENIRAVYRSLTETDLCFQNVHNENREEVKLTRKLFQDLMISKNSEVRKEALKVRNEAYEKNKNTLAILLLQKYQAEIKRKGTYGSLLEKTLGDNELPSTIVTDFIRGAHENIAILRDYTNSKKKFLGVNEFCLSDTFLPLGLISKMSFELEEAVSIIKNALGVLGSEYVSKIDQAFIEGWVDVYPKEGKRKMSYSCISYGGVPYVSLNYNKSLTSVRTLIHELGHSIHTDYAKTNSFLYFEYSLFLSEVVSKVNEILLNDYLLSQDIENEEKIYLLNHIVSSLGNSLFGQVMLTEFEHKVISKLEDSQSLNALILGEIYHNLYMDYYGDSILIDVDNSYEWTRIPHFVMNPSYYLYQYSAGVALAIEIVHKIKENKDCFCEKYIEFLKIGNTKSIEDSLNILGIDLKNGEYISSAYHYLEEKVSELKLLKK